MHLSYKRLMSYLLLLFCSSYPRFLLSIFPSLILIFSFFFLELCITLFKHHFFVFPSSSFIFLSFVFPLLSQSWEFAYLLFALSLKITHFERKSNREQFTLVAL